MLKLRGFEQQAKKLPNYQITHLPNPVSIAHLPNPGSICLTLHFHVDIIKYGL